MASKVGTLIKEARTGAGLTQEQLAKKIKGLSAAELGKAERGEAELSQAILKEIAKTTGVTQSSLLSAAKESTPAKKTASTTAKKTATAAKSTAAKKTATAAKSTAAKKTATAAKSTTAKKTTSTAKKTASKTSELTAAEKKLLEAYREATADNKKLALKILKGEGLDLGDMMGQFKLDGKEGGSGDLLSGLKDGLLGGLLGKK